MNLGETLRTIDYNSLPVSDYSRNYILRMLPHIDYYLQIYRYCIERLIGRLGKEPAAVTLVDYGGGHGFFSCCAKEMGVGRVVYIDYNPLASACAEQVRRAAAIGADEVLTGGSAELRQWFQSRGEQPDAVAGMDVIEHIYCLEAFFGDLHALNPSLCGIFTTGSTPFNPIVRRRLHRYMKADELGSGSSAGYLAQRRAYIEQHLPSLSCADAERWARLTRGRTFADALRDVESNRAEPLADPYNTCNPATGSWSERILPLSDYERMASDRGWRADLGLGWYNPYRSGAKGAASRGLNLLIRRLGLRCLAPFIVLETGLRRREECVKR